MNVATGGSFLLCTSQCNHAQRAIQKNKTTKTQQKVERNSKIFKIKNMEVCEVMAHTFQEEEYVGK